MSVLSKAIYGLIATSIKLSITFFTEIEQKLKIFMETKRTSQNEEFKLMQTLWRTVWRLLKNIKIELSCDLAISLLDIDLISRGNYNSKRYTSQWIRFLLFVCVFVYNHILFLPPWAHSLNHPGCDVWCLQVYKQTVSDLAFSDH